MHGQTAFKILGIVFWIIAIVIIMATYGVLGKPLLESGLSKGLFEGEYKYSDSYFVLSVLLLTMGTFLIVYPFKK